MRCATVHEESIGDGAFGAVGGIVAHRRLRIAKDARDDRCRTTGVERHSVGRTKAAHERAEFGARQADRIVRPPSVDGDEEKRPVGTFCGTGARKADVRLFGRRSGGVGIRCAVCDQQGAAADGLGDVGERRIGIAAQSDHVTGFRRR